MPTYQEYLDQIAKLQSLAAIARQDEMEEARKKIQDLMKTHGISVEELARRSKNHEGRRNSSGKVAVKFVDPATGASWTGRGRAPKWIEGKDKSKFAIE